MSLVDIRELPKAAVIAALWNNATKRSVFDARSAMSETRAIGLVEALDHLNFDWVDGRSVKVDLTADWFDPWLYDRDNGGDGAAHRVISKLRANLNMERSDETQKVPEVDARKASQIPSDSEGEAREAPLSSGGSDIGAGNGGQKP